MLVLLLAAAKEVTMTDIKSQIQAERVKALARAQKLADLERLADDPEAIEILRELLLAKTPHVRNGDGGATPSQPTPDPGTIWLSHSLKRRRPARGSQFRRVVEVLRTAVTPVTSEWIVEQMQASGYAFTAQKPTVAVNDSLRIAERKGMARLVRSAGHTNFWEARV
jgi:hypothetical protein